MTFIRELCIYIGIVLGLLMFFISLTGCEPDWNHYEEYESKQFKVVEK